MSSPGTPARAAAPRGSGREPSSSPDVIPLRMKSFLKLTLLALLLGGGGRVAGAEPDAITVGLSQYSLRQLFAAKTLDPLDYPAFAQREFGIRTIDVYEGGLPKDRLDDFAYLRELRQRATAIGSTIFLWMAGVVDATGATPAARQAAHQAHLASLARAEVMGCTYLRVFLKAPNGERGPAVQAATEALRPLAERAQAKGIVVVIEPGASTWSARGDFLADVMRAMQHPHCRLMPDFGKLAGDVYAGTQAMMPYAAVISAKTHEFDAAGNQVDFDYARLMRIVREAGFRGVVAVEWEGKRQLPIEGTRASVRLVERTLRAPAAAAAASARPAPDPALAPVADVPGLPRVLLIGDSISIGYTLPVRAALQGRANVHRPPGNCSSTGYTLSKLEEWLGAGKWDVIHFNWGLHDAKLPPEGVRHAPPEVYEQNLRRLVARLQATGAKLIWATTTPVPMGGNLAPNRRFGSVDAYNAIAAKVMAESGVATNDLNAAITPHVAQFGRPNDVHFTPEGSAFLAGHVTRSVAAQLPAR